jgi:capsular exopolysaccharide synthesis family protein
LQGPDGIGGFNSVTWEEPILQDNSNILLPDPVDTDEESTQGSNDSLFLVMWRERYLIGACTFVCLLFAGVYLLVATPIYTSTARMSVTLAGSPLTGQTASMNDAATGSYLYTEREVISSPAVLSLAAQMPEVKPLLTGQSSPIKFLQTNLNVDIGKRDTIISVGFSSNNRVGASNTANAIVKAYTQYQTRPKPAAIAELDRVIGERAKLEQHVADTTRQMLELEQKYGVLTATSGQGSIAERQLAALSQELHTAHLETLKAQAEHEEAQLSIKGIVNRDGIQDPADTLPIGQDQKVLIQSTLMQLDTQLQDLRRRYLPDHPLVVSAQHRINQVRLLYARAIEREFNIAQQREKDLQSEYEGQEKQAIAVSAALAQYLRLQSDLDNDRKTEGQIDDRRRQIEISRDLGMLNIDPFELAQPELKPSRPSKLIVLSVGVLVGLLVGNALGFLHNMFDDRFRTVDEMRGMTGLKLLGLVPKMPEDLPPAVIGQQSLLEPMSGIAEACRMIRTAIHFGAAKDRRRSILITSASSGEGKSTLASNLAITVAQAGKRVLLVDADLRLPTLHKIFGVDNDHGLSSLLQGQITLDEAVETTEINGLELLPSGPPVQNPAELLNSPVFTELLDTLFDRYDQIILDSAPVVGIVDSRIVAAACDVTVLVLRGGASTRRMNDLARQGLTSVGAQVLGMVINAAADDAAPYPYSDRAARPAMRHLRVDPVEHAEHVEDEL